MSTYKWNDETSRNEKTDWPEGQQFVDIPNQIEKGCWSWDNVDDLFHAAPKAATSETVPKCASFYTSYYDEGNLFATINGKTKYAWCNHKQAWIHFNGV